MTDAEKKIYESLRHKRSFELMPEPMFIKLLKMMKVARFNIKETIIKQGEESKAIYVILHGRVSIYVNGRYVYDMRRTGDLFGEMGFVMHRPSSATIRAEEEVNAVIFSYEMLPEIGDADFYKWICRILAEKVIRTSTLSPSPPSSSSPSGR